MPSLTLSIPTKWRVVGGGLETSSTRKRWPLPQRISFRTTTVPRGQFAWLPDPDRIAKFGCRLTSQSINRDLPGAAAIDGEWRSELPDGTEVVVQRHDQQWIVHCGSSHAISKNLDIALAQAIHAETGFVTGAQDVHYPSLIRGMADNITSNQ